MAKADKKTLRKRERNAADVWMNNPALRENLDDVQAEPVLNWGFDQTADLSDNVAGKKADALVEKLQSSLPWVSLLTKIMPGCRNKLAAAKDDKQFLALLYGDKEIPVFAENDAFICR